MEYTKGPWRIASYGTSILSEDTVIAEKPHDKIVPDSNWEANAPMLTASPDLYEALNALVRAYNNMSVPELCKQHELWQAAENALLKAEGKEAE